MVSIATNSETGLLSTKKYPLIQFLVKIFLSGHPVLLSDSFCENIHQQSICTKYYSSCTRLQSHWKNVCFLCQTTT